MARELAKFDLTREDIPPLEGHDWTRETPFCEAMASQDLRVESATPERFQKAWILGCLMMELANPGMKAITRDHAYDAEGRVTSATVAVVPKR